MRIQEAITKAIEGGYITDQLDDPSRLVQAQYFLETSFWEALARALGWEGDCSSGSSLQGLDKPWAMVTKSGNERPSSLGGSHGEQGNTCDLLLVQVLPDESRGPTGRITFNDLVRGHDQVDAEVVPGLRKCCINDLQRVDGRHDHGARADQPGLLEQRDLDV